MQKSCELIRKQIGGLYSNALFSGRSSNTDDKWTEDLLELLFGKPFLLITAFLIVFTAISLMISPFLLIVTLIVSLVGNYIGTAIASMMGFGKKESQSNPFTKTSCDSNSIKQAITNFMGADQTGTDAEGGKDASTNGKELSLEITLGLFVTFISALLLKVQLDITGSAGLAIGFIALFLVGSQLFPGPEPQPASLEFLDLDMILCGVAIVLATVAACRNPSPITVLCSIGIIIVNLIFLYIIYDKRVEWEEQYKWDTEAPSINVEIRNLAWPKTDQFYIVFTVHDNYDYPCFVKLWYIDEYDGPLYDEDLVDRYVVKPDGTTEYTAGCDMSHGFYYIQAYDRVDNYGPTTFVRF